MYQGTLEPRTNRASWTQNIAITDPDTGNAFDLTGFSIQFEIRRRPGGRSGAPITPYYDTTSYDCGPVLTATTANGAAKIVDVGVVQIYFSEAQMKTLCAETYAVGMTLTDPSGVNTEQILLCTLPILFGGVSN